VPAAPRRQAKLTDGPNGMVAGGNMLRSELDSRLRSKRLTPGQRRLAQCLIERSGEIGHLSSTELAELAKVSQPSVTRFATALGYDGFFDMRRQLRTGAPVAPSATETTANRFQSAALAEAANVTELARNLDADSLQGIGKALADSRPLVVLGLRASMGLAAQFCYFGAKVHPDIRITATGGSLIEDEIDQAVAAGGRCLLAFMMPLYPGETLKALQYAKTLGLETVVVSDATYVDHDGLADRLLTARINSRLVFDSYAACAVLVSVLLDAMCDALADYAQRRLEQNERSSTRRKVFAR
jgi:DNA-binding MurR/RpiR family transcriptional regulator